MTTMEKEGAERSSPINFSRRKAFSGGGKSASPPPFFSLHSSSTEEGSEGVSKHELLSPTSSSGYGSDSSIRSWSQELVEGWLEDGSDSYCYFQALLKIFELSLDPSTRNFRYFHSLLAVLDASDAALRFLHLALPYLIDSDFVHHTDYVDLLLLDLAMYQIHTGNEILEDFVTNTPSFGGFYLRQHGKHFEELFTYIHSHHSYEYNPDSKEMTVHVRPHYLADMHFQSKKVIVSNAPPIKLKRRQLRTREKFECQDSAGGLVSGIKPSLEKNDVWVSYLDTKLMELERMPKQMIPKVIRESVRVAPKIRRSTSVLRYSLTETAEDEEKLTDFLYEKTENDFMSLQRRLDRFAEKNFVVNPLIIMKEDHEGFYNGISNGLLWPAFHGLPQYIIQEYLGTDGQENLADDWEHYMKVNFHFAIHAARSCRQQDFLWIHDYHLFLVGEILRALDPSLDCGFFLHIPFRISDEFMVNFEEQGRAVIKGEKSMITNVGTFPISIKTDRINEILGSLSGTGPSTLRDSIMRHRTGALFLSVERFDYTKGLLERLNAIDLYFKKHPERREMDLFYQIAASSRTDVSSYRKYQQDVLNKVLEINEKYGSEEGPVIFVDQQNRPQEDVIQLYQAADVVVVTPMADGMNLVIKEAVLCNPKAVLVLSTGAGAENQLFDAGLGHCYVQVPDIHDSEVFADCLDKAASVPLDVRISCGSLLQDFTKRRDIDFWINSFTSNNWTASVVEVKEGLDLCRKDFHGLIERVSQMQAKTASAMHVDHPVGAAARINLENVIWILENYKSEILNDPQNDQNIPAVAVEDLDSYKQDLKLDLLTVYMLAASEDPYQCRQAYKDLSEDHSKFEEDVQSLEQLFTQVYPLDCVILQADTWLLSKVSLCQGLTSGFLLPRLFSRLAQNVVILSDTFTGEELKQRLQFEPEFGAMHIGKPSEPGHCVEERLERIRTILKSSSKSGGIKSCLFFCGGPSDALLANHLKTENIVKTISQKRERGSLAVFYSTDIELSSRESLYAASISQIEKPITIKI